MALRPAWLEAAVASVDPRRWLALVALTCAAVAWPFEARGRGWVAHAPPEGGLWLSAGSHRLLRLLPSSHAAREHLEPSAAGVEQSWRFDAAPPGRADLTIRVPVLGEGPSSSGPGGLRFGGPARSDAVLYGAATFIDASGRETGVAPRFEAGAIVLTVPRRVLDAAAWPAVLDPLISAETGPSAPLCESNRRQYLPSLTTDGTDFLVAWEDFDTGTTHITAARISAAGAVLDPLGIPVSAPTWGNWAAAGFDGQDWLVAWGDEDFVGPVRRSVKVQRISRAGQRVGPPIIVDATADNDPLPAFANGPTGALLVWLKYVGATETLQGALFWPDGGYSLLPQPVIAQTGWYTSAGWNGSSYVVLASGHFNSDPFLAQQVSEQGALMGPPLPLPNTKAANLAAGDGVALAAFTEGSTRLRALRIGSDGGVLDPDGGVVVSAGTGIYEPAVGWGPGAFYLSWTQGADDGGGYEVRAARVTPDGTVLDPQGVVVGTTDGYKPAVAATPSAVLVSVDAVVPSHEPPLFVDLLSPALQRLAPRQLVTYRRSLQGSPLLAAGPNGFLLAWGDDRDQADAGYGLYATRVSPQGAIADEPPLRLVSALPSSSWPLGAWFDGSGYVVVWKAGAGVFAGHVSSAGAVLDVGGVPLFDAGQQSGIVAPLSAGRGLMAWSRYSSDGGTEVSATPFDLGAQPSAGAPIEVQRGIGSFCGFTAAGAAGRVLIAWCEGWPQPRLRAVTVDGAGQLRGSDAGIDLTLGTALNVGPLSASPVDGGFAVAWAIGAVDGGFVVAQEYGLDADPRAQQVLLQASPSWQVAPAVAWNGSRYFVAWEDRRAYIGTFRDGLDVYSAFFPDDAGTPGGAQLSAVGPGLKEEPIAVSDGLGHTAVAWMFYGMDGEERVRLRVVTDELPRGAPCAQGPECASGRCVDAVCCDSACGGGAADCQACSVAAGAAADGVCGPVAMGTMCRAATGPCDAPEACDGVASACPADLLRTAAEVCRPSAGACDVEERCDGVSATCGTDARADAGTPCRAAAGPCDVPERCDGVAAACGPDAVAEAGTPCRAAADVCDVPERCDGVAAVCPADQLAEAGMVCGPALPGCMSEQRCTGTEPACPTTCAPPRSLAVSCQCGSPDGGVLVALALVALSRRRRHSR